MVGAAVNRPRNRVDALAERVDTDPFTTIRDTRVTFHGGNPLFVVGFEVCDELLGTVAYLDEFVNKGNGEFDTSLGVFFV